MKTQFPLSARCAAATCLLLTLNWTHAQIFNIDWSTIDGGGGTSVGGGYSVSGTLGQPDAGMMNGANYTLIGGFWGVTITTLSPLGPRLSIERLSDGSVRVFWPLPATGFVLEESATLTGSPDIPWAEVSPPYQTNATHILLSVPTPATSRFYRLSKP